jgi:hypothetical protein
MQWTRITSTRTVPSMTTTDITTQPTTTHGAVNHVFFMQVCTTTAWLALTPNDRFAFLGETIAPILGRHPDVTMRFFDSEAFNARYTDVVMWETASIMSYQRDGVLGPLLRGGRHHRLDRERLRPPLRRRPAVNLYPSRP